MSLWLCCVVICRVLGLLARPLQKISEDQVRFIDELSTRWVPWAIAASACGSLALELAMIGGRAQCGNSSHFIRTLAFFLALPVLDLAMPYRIESAYRWRFRFHYSRCKLLLVAMRNGMGSGRITSLMATPFTEQLHMGRIAAADVPHLSAVYLFLCAVMLLTALVFVPVGQICGRLLERITALRVMD